MKGRELKELQKTCLNLAYLIQKNIDAYDDDLEETYSDLINELFKITAIYTKYLNEKHKDSTSQS